MVFSTKGKFLSQVGTKQCLFKAHLIQNRAMICDFKTCCNCYSVIFKSKILRNITWVNNVSDRSFGLVFLWLENYIKYLNSKLFYLSFHFTSATWLTKIFFLFSEMSMIKNHKKIRMIHLFLQEENFAEFLCVYENLQSDSKI